MREINIEKTKEKRERLRGIVVLIFPLDFCSEFGVFLCGFGEEKKEKRGGRGEIRESEGRERERETYGAKEERERAAENKEKREKIE